uniref:F-box domain-containing protein n=1 Tax=Anopheles atroparvus TaxID=41427 RepID=A0A182J6W3_ANOAO
MSCISDLPTEMTDHIFSFLPFADQKSARLVCRHWHQQLSSSRFWKATKLRLALCKGKEWSVDDLLRAAGQGKFTCIEVVCGYHTTDNRSFIVMKLLEASSFSLEELQFTSFPLNVFAKDLLLRCLNELHLPALHSLTLTTVSFAPIQPEDLGGGFSRMLEQLQTFKCTDARLFCSMLPKMVKHCHNLKFLAIANCCISNQCAEQIFALKGLKDLRLKSVRVMHSSDRDPPLLELSYLENVLLSPIIGIRITHFSKCSPNHKHEDRF